MNVLVTDASVILKWVLSPGTEDFQQQAWAISDAVGNRCVEIKVPSLWFFEVGNLLARKYPARAEQQLDDLLTALGPGEPLPDPDWQRQILDLTARYRVTFYDAAYHALAIIRNGVLVTADEKYLEAVAERLTSHTSRITDDRPPPAPETHRHERAHIPGLPRARRDRRAGRRFRRGRPDRHPHPYPGGLHRLHHAGAGHARFPSGGGAGRAGGNAPGLGG